jgi:hypothetical protein
MGAEPMSEYETYYGIRSVLGTGFVNVVKPTLRGTKYHCPCCGYRTLYERGGYDICQVCFWEDDGQDNHDADEVRGGPNHTLSLSEARRNFLKIGACEERVLKHVRPPNEGEKPANLQGGS